MQFGHKFFLVCIEKKVSLVVANKMNGKAWYLWLYAESLRPAVHEK